MFKDASLARLFVRLVLCSTLAPRVPLAFTNTSVTACIPAQAAAFLKAVSVKYAHSLVFPANLLPTAFPAKSASYSINCNKPARRHVLQDRSVQCSLASYVLFHVLHAFKLLSSVFPASKETILTTFVSSLAPESTH